MNVKEIQQLLALINKAVNEDGKVWKEKRNQILAEADDDDKINLSEFGSWFED